MLISILGAKCMRWALGAKVWSWSAKGFDLEAALERSGIFFEIGGPTTDGYLLDMRPYKEKFVISNVEFPEWEDQPDAAEDVEVIADGQRLPLRDGALTVLFASCMPRWVRAGILKESQRVLSTGGLLIWKGATILDLYVAEAMGYRLVHYRFETPRLVCAMLGVRFLGRTRSRSVYEISQFLPTRDVRALPYPEEENRLWCRMVPGLMVFQK